MNSAVLQEIRRLEHDGESGQLYLTHKEEQVRIFFYDGHIDAISANNPGRQIGAYFLRNELLESSELDRLIARARKQRVPTGEVAVDYEVLSPSRLVAFLEEQADEIFRRIISEDFSVGPFETNPKLFKYPLRTSLEALVLRFHRKDASGGNFGPGYRFSLSPDTALSHLPWTPEELLVLGHLNYPRTISQLVSDTGTTEVELSKTLGLLDRMDFLQISNGTPSSGVSLVRHENPVLEFLVPEIHAQSLTEKLEVWKSEHSFVSEQFKSLKVRLSELELENPLQIISISSPSTKDGKSLISANLACCMAQDPGRRVLLLDCDLRNPTVNRNFGVSLQPGLIDYLVHSNMEPYCYIRRIGNLYLLTAGGIAENPVELLSMGRMKKLVEFLKENFDSVVVDCPPMNPVADARVVSSLADANILVVRSGKTAYRLIEQTLRSIDATKFLGVVFNDVKPMMFHTYHNYGYYYYGSTNPYAQRTGSEKRSRKRSQL